VYLARFPEAAPMTQLADFQFLRLRPLGARQVAGFGAARSLNAHTLGLALGAPG
jgi:heme iron utilization protein